MTFQLKTVLACFLFVLLLSTSIFAQRKAIEIQNKWTTITADGDLGDWQDSLSMFHSDSKLFYALANDEDHIYLALQSKNPELLSKIMIGGITFSVNTEVEKKNPPRVTFPILDRTPGKPKSSREVLSKEEIQDQTLERIKDIRVFGFKEIIDGPISLQNNYGIRAAAGFDSRNNFVQEIAIPIRLLNIVNRNEEITYKIRINGIGERPNTARSSYPMSPYGNPYGNPYPTQQIPKQLLPTEFQIKSKLASQ